MIRAVQGPPLTDSKDSQTFRTDTKRIVKHIAAVLIQINAGSVDARQVPRSISRGRNPRMSVTHAETGLPTVLASHRFADQHPQLAPFIVAVAFFAVSLLVALALTGLPT